MTTTAAIGDHLGLLDKERIIAPADYNRWLVPPAALAIHLCIGMAYGFSVFWKPLQGALLGADGKAVPECSAAATTFGEKAAGTLQALFGASANDLQAVEGVGESRARVIRDGLVRLAESAYTERVSLSS